MKAREFLAQSGKPVEARNIIKEPLTLAEVKALAARVASPEDLVAPKRRAEAAGLKGAALLAWLAGAVEHPGERVGGVDVLAAHRLLAAEEGERAPELAAARRQVDGELARVEALAAAVEVGVDARGLVPFPGAREHARE